jgi:hypothetical protein
MKRPTRIIPALLAMACVMAATATAAQAITIEPLNKSFKGTKVGATVESGGEGRLECSLTVSGTTNSTKTNYVNVTPAFTGCSFGGFAIVYTNTSTCETGQSVPWTLTLNEGTNPYKGTTRVNCVGKFQIGEVCPLEILRQTAPSNRLTWDSGGENSFLTLNEEKLKYRSGSEACILVGWPKEGTLTLSTKEFEIAGIKAT